MHNTLQSARRMSPLRQSLLLILFVLVSMTIPLRADTPAGDNSAKTKKILILVEGNTELTNYAYASGRKIANLLGHFNATATVKGVNEYKQSEISLFDQVFYLGFHLRNAPPQRFYEDILRTKKTVVWINTGLKEVCEKFPGLATQFGFSVTDIDTLSKFNLVKAGTRTYTKGSPYVNMVAIKDHKKVAVLATTQNANRQKESPYLVRSGNFYYVADNPFELAELGTDRYIYFADILHDILGENHPASHKALIRIEDVNPMSNPEKLEEIADILSKRHIPFLVGVFPFYINPSQSLKVSLSDKQEVVDALHYMVSKGATIVMHGTTHQYKGISGNDFEFWDESTNKPIKGETVSGIDRKIEDGIQELMKNGIYPLLWETPHYTASIQFYETIGKYFSTAMETRLTVEDFDCGQYFPYILYKDIYGQKIYPEDLGYVPLDASMEVEENYIKTLLNGAKTTMGVRDGFASCFFHPFINLDLLKELVDGMEALGYTYMDVKTETNRVRTENRTIISGSQDISLKLDDQYLLEQYFNAKGELVSKSYSPTRLSGTINKSITLKPGEVYTASPVEIKDQSTSKWEKVVDYTKSMYTNLFKKKRPWQEPKICILWNTEATGAEYNDQASMASIFTALNINVDTMYVGTHLDIGNHNILLLPYGSANKIAESESDAIVSYVKEGGNVITDWQNNLLEDFGIFFSPAKVSINKLRDKYFPEQEISLAHNELISKVETENYDEIFCTEASSETPLAFGKKFGLGKIMYFTARFDSHTQYGYSTYPFAMEYMKRYFAIHPLFRRDNLEMYFDPGFRNSYTIESLVKMWVLEGIRVIHVAGWHQYAKYTYDYDRLIKLAHANGILVYAWIEPPQVNQIFWESHPQWREKNYLGKDVRPSWRFPMALTDEACVTEMIAEYNKLLTAYDWDGVNLAEVYFEAGEGFSNPELFTPMHSSAQAAFKHKYGIDLPSIFTHGSANYWAGNPTVKNLVTEFRVAEIKKVYTRLLGFLHGLAQQKNGFQIIVTTLDNLGSPELREYIATDVEQLIELNKQYPFRLQVEDPEKRWSEDPYRYREIADRYRQLVGNDFMLDLNILTFRKPEAVTPFPTLIQTGAECFHLIRAAALSARYTIYAESSINPQDLFYLPYANTAGLHYRDSLNGYLVESPFSSFLKLPDDKKNVKVDGVFVAASRENQVFIPAGRHFIEIGIKASEAYSDHDLQTRIMSITANVLAVEYKISNVYMEYVGDTRVLASFDHEPTKVIVDGLDYPVSPLKGNDCYSIFLPQGHHHVEIIAGSKFSDGVNLLSLWSSTTIALFGILSVASLVLMYFSLKVIRRRLAVR